MSLSRRPHSLFSVALYVSAALFVILVLTVPLYLAVRTGTAWQEALETLSRPATWRVIRNTITITLAVTVTGIGISIPLAWLTTRTDLPLRRVWTVLHALPLVIPSYIYAFLFVSFLSPKGLLQQILEGPLQIERLPNIYGFTGAYIVLTLISYPYLYLTVQAALRQMDPTLIEAAQINGANKRQIFRHALLPYLGPSVTSGSLLVALYCLRDFGAVTLLQYSTFTRVIYTRYQSYRLDEAATLSAVLVLMTVMILMTESVLRSRQGDLPEEIENEFGGKRFKLGRWRWPALILNLGFSTLSLFLPISILGYWFVRGLRKDWVVQGISTVQQNTIDFASLWEPARISVGVGLFAAVLGALVAVPITILSLRQRHRFVARAIERISYLSYALPGIVVAFAFVYAGINLIRPLYQTLPMLIAAYLVLFVPQAVSAERGVYARIPEELEEIGYSMGGSALDIFRYVTFPLMRPGIVTGGLLVFLTVMKELPATLILSPLGHTALSTVIWTNIEEAFFARAAVPTLLLILLSSLPLAWFTYIDNREG